MMDFGLLGVAEIEGLMASLEGFNLASIGEALALTGTAHSFAGPGSELASARTAVEMQAQVAEMDAICQASGANIMAYLMVGQANKAGSVATDMATAVPFTALSAV
ncbi:hypothetical protein [Mycobacteroides abscessus]|uniref:hypothetical protein n=1 Tax=Mycobacteroides abscessus TaxID=36809 RepID=UPI001896785D